MENMKGLSKTALYIAIAIVAIAAAGSFIAYNQLARQQPIQPARYSVVIATGGIGGIYYYYGATVAGIISNYTDISATSVQTAASIDNMLLIRDKTDLARGVIYCATLNPLVAYPGYTGELEKVVAYPNYIGWLDRFRNATVPISILWSMYPNYFHIVTTADSGIKSVYDLKGKRVSTQAPGSATEVWAFMLLKIIGIDPAKDFSKWERLGAAESANALSDGAIDAYFWDGGLPTGSVLELSKTLAQKGRKLYLVPIPDEVIREFMRLYPGIVFPSVISKDVYGTDRDTQSIAYWNMFVCHKNIPPDVAYKITKAVFEHLDILQKAISAARDTTPQNAVKQLGGAITYNEGALRYFREIGVVK